MCGTDPLTLMRDKTEEKLLTMGKRAKNAKRLLALLYRHPTVTTAQVYREMRISQVAADQLIKTFIQAGILVETTGFKRNRLFQFKRYFQLFLK
jgi:hypothetical protein